MKNPNSVSQLIWYCEQVQTHGVTLRSDIDIEIPQNACKGFLSLLVVYQSGSVGFTLWGRLLTWQLCRRQWLTPSTRRLSLRRSSLKRMAVHRVLYPNLFLESWVDVEKGGQATGITTAWRGLSSKGHPKMCGSFIRSGLRQECIKSHQAQTWTWATSTVAFLVSVSYLG